MLGEASLAQEFRRELYKNRRVGMAIGYPTVPQGKARIRVMISAAHSKDDLDKGLKTFAKVGKNWCDLSPNLCRAGNCPPSVWEAEWERKSASTLIVLIVLSFSCYSSGSTIADRYKHTDGQIAFASDRDGNFEIYIMTQMERMYAD